MREMPFDMFFFRFLSPYLLKFLKPSAWFSALVKQWFSKVAQKLRISHFLIGKEIQDEEKLPRTEEHQTYMRVPNHDRVEPLGWKRMHIRMRKDEPVFGADRDHLDSIGRDWTKVYVPDQIRLRVFHSNKDIRAPSIAVDKLCIWNICIH